MYRCVDPKELPSCESLKTTIDRVVPYFNDVIKQDMLEGKRVIIAAHGNSLRALVKYFDKISEEDIVNLNIPTGIPLIYEFDAVLKAMCEVLDRSLVKAAPFTAEDLLHTMVHNIVAEGKESK